MKKSKIGWAIKNKHGDLLIHTIEPYRKMCIEEFTRINKQTWPDLKKLGAQCVKVKITEL
ncbi:hypothetical protein DCC81_12035 [Chitinophaga parva]|uniref:Uncharacterized protein n=1 Tax=Chitinophaga parva TaxID=2169414 RepID=A0A2T7BFH3_9BACT|nr:hypothetical protein DCC81_12035 [Chitinophaga parva]